MIKKGNNANFALQLKYSLIVINVILLAILISLLIFWLVSVKPAQVAKGQAINQYKVFLLAQLPSGEDNIKADYIGEKEQNSNGKVIDSNNDAPHTNLADNTRHDSDEMANNVNQLLEKTNQILRESSGKIEKKDDNIQESQPVSSATNISKVSIIITNLGLNKRSTELALTLPKECALGFLPYTKSLKPLLLKAQNNGHEIYLYLPLQSSKSSDDPGKYALLADGAPEENAVRLNVILNSHSKYKGVYSNYKEMFTDNAQATEGVVDQLEDKNLILLLGKTAKKTLPVHLKGRQNIVPASLIIDEEPSKEYIVAQLAKLVKLAQQNGHALGYAQGFTLTIDTVKEWVSTLEKNGVTLVPVSELLKD